jgi:pimeloyl-ACP methyl ester carboxylesterase
MKILAQNVTGIKVPKSGHFIPEEQPQFVIKQLAISLLVVILLKLPPISKS